MDREIIRKYPRLRKYIAIGLPVLTVVALGIWAICANRTKTYRTDKAGMTFGEVTRGTFNDYIRLSGKIETGMVVQLSAMETGIVEHKWVEEGASVNSGDLILTLHNPNLRQQILDSESQLAERQNMLRDTELAMEKERMQLKQDLLTARTELTRKRRLYIQQKTLFEEKLTSREEFLKAEEDYRLAEENLKLIGTRLRQDSIYRSVQLSMMRESLDNMRQNLLLVRQRADNLNIRASRSGQLGSLTAEIGQSIAAGQQVGQINMTDNYKLTAMVDEHYVDRVEPGQAGKMERNGKEHSVRVNKVYPEVDQGKFKVDLTIEGVLPENIRVGQSFHIDLQLGEAVEAVMVPRGSFFQTTGGNWVYVVESDGKGAYKRSVKVGRQNPRYYEILDGLKPGERIITSSYADFGEADRIIIDN